MIQDHSKRMYWIILLCLSVTQAVKMPDFIPTCKLNDPKLNECAAVNGQKSIAGLVKGDRRIGLPNLVPLKIPRIDIHTGGNLKILLTNNEVSGLDGTIVKAIEFYLEKKHMVFHVFIPRANIIGHYKMDGRIMILPIQGEGRANITFINGYYDYAMNYTLVPGKDGKEYLTIMDHSIVFNTSRAYYDFKNLFGGNNALGAHMNQFLNENWQAVTKDLGATVGETISSIITSLARNIFIKVPFEEVLLPD